MLYACLVWMVVLLFVPSASARASIDSISFYRARFFQTDEDTSRSSVRAIAQTTNGFLWVGTEKGLARFDGHRFDYLSFSSLTNGLDRAVSALATDRDGHLWIGTRSRLLQLVNGEEIRDPLPMETNRNIISLAYTADETVWIGTQTGLLRKEKGRNSTKTSPNVGYSSIRALATDAKGYLWVGAGEGFARLTPGDQDEVVNYNFRSLKLDFIRSVCRRQDGSLWLGSNSGLVRFVNGTFTRFTRNEGLPDNTVTSVYEDRRGDLWIGTFGGLCRFVGGKLQVEMTTEGEPYSQVNCFFEDRENNLWVGTKEGLYQFTSQQFASLTTRHGLAHNNVISVFEDTATNLWIGTWGGGLHRLSNDELTIHSSANNTFLRNDLVLALHGGRDGSLWFSQDYDGGLYQYDQGKFKHFNEKAGLARNAIRAIMEDREGRLWLARATDNLTVLQDGRFTSFGRQHGLPTNAVRCLLEAKDGTLWIGTASGLCVWTNGGFNTWTTDHGLTDNTIFSLYEDQERNLWIGTGRGLNRLSPETSRSDIPSPSKAFLTYPLLNDAVLEILEDDVGNFWLATRRGVIRVRKDKLEDFDAGKITSIPSTRFIQADGMASQVCVGVAKPSAFRSRDGRLWFATTKGLAVTDPKLKIEKNDKAPPVMIRDVLVDKNSIFERTGEKERTGRGEKQSSSFLLFPSAPLLTGPGRGELEFHYSALSYTAPEKNRFKYRLDGLDADWVDAGDRKTAFYNNIPPGNYTFRVIACNNDGVWNEVGAKFNLILQPHYWQTWWFKSLAVITSLFFVGATVRIVTRKRLQLKLERLEQQHAVERERSRIARDMHDDLGVRLMQILVLGDLVQRNKSQPHEMDAHLGKMTRATQDVVQSLDGIVWAVNPENDYLDRFVGYILEFAETLLNESSIRYRVDMPATFPHIPLSSETRHHLLLVLKEFLNNVVKHSDASEVHLRFQMSGAAFVLEVEDNGKGFTPASASSFGNGLKNMEERIRQVGGSFDLVSAPGKGTRIRLEVSLKVIRNPSL